MSYRRVTAPPGSYFIFALVSDGTCRRSLSLFVLVCFIFSISFTRFRPKYYTGTNQRAFVHRRTQWWVVHIIRVIYMYIYIY